MGHEAGAPIELPTPDEIVASVFAIEAALADDPLAGREQLRRVFRDGKIRLRPCDDGIFEATAELLPLRLFLGTPETTSPTVVSLGRRVRGG